MERDYHGSALPIAMLVLGIAVSLSFQSLQTASSRVPVLFVQLGVPLAIVVLLLITEGDNGN